MISILIPCRNEESYIGRCIDSVLSQTFEGKIEVIVVDGMSNDGTRKVLSKYGQAVKVIDNPTLHTPAALNLGIYAAQYPLVMILGAHAELEKSYVANCLSAFQEKPEVGCVGGVLENVYENETAKTIGLAMSSPFGVGNAHFRTGAKSGEVDTVAFGTYRAEIFKTVGYFDESLVRNQDDEFNYRLTKHKIPIWLDKRLKAKYYVRASYSKLRKQYYQYGYWKVFVNKKHSTITTTRQLIPSVFVAFILSSLIAILWPSYILLWAFGLALYGVMALWFATSKSKNIIQTFQIVYTFFLLHWSYGMGYLRGLLHFIILDKDPTDNQKTLSR